MAEFPAHLVHEHRLSDGRTVTIRPIRATDEAPEREFFDRLSGETRYLRFLKWVQAPSERMIHFFTDIDYDQHMAFVCATEKDGAEQVVGEARYVVNADGKSCEFGIVIADDWHKTGIAGLLMEALIGAARARGLTAMDGLVLATNSEMLRFTRALGFKVEAVPEDLTTLRIVKRL